MKSALCLLSGKSCARLIEMFIRQIYRDKKGGGKAHSTGRAQELQQARQAPSPGSLQTGPGGGGPGAGVWCLLHASRACSASCEGWGRRKVDLDSCSLCGTVGGDSGFMELGSQPSSEKALFSHHSHSLCSKDITVEEL